MSPLLEHFNLRIFSTFRTSKIKNSVKNLMRMGKQRSWSANDKDELLQNAAQAESSHAPHHEFVPLMGGGNATSSDNESVVSLFEEPVGAKR